MTVMLINQASKPATGGGGSTPFTFETTSNVTTEADGGYTQTSSGGNSYATTVQRIASFGTDRLGVVFTATGIGNQIVNLVPVSSLPFSSRTGQHFFFKNGGNIDIYIDGGYYDSFASAVSDEIAWGFDGAGRITVLKNGVVMVTHPTVRSSEDYAIQMWVDSGAPAGTGFESGSKT